MSVDYAAIGQRIKGRRREQKRTQEWLAEQLQVSVGYISQIERGVTKVNLDTLSEIGASLGCDLGELVTLISIPEILRLLGILSFGELPMGLFFVLVYLCSL